MGFNAIIEVPAGTNRKLEIQPDGQFVAELMNGVPRVVNFLPYPGNYGFIPSTLMDEARGGDGEGHAASVAGRRADGACGDAARGAT